MAKEVVGHLKILFPLADNAVNDTFIFLDKPFLDGGLHPDLWKQLGNEMRYVAKGDVQRMKCKNTVRNSSYT